MKQLLLFDCKRVKDERIHLQYDAVIVSVSFILFTFYPFLGATVFIHAIIIFFINLDPITIDVVVVCIIINAIG